MGQVISWLGSMGGQGRRSSHGGMASGNSAKWVCKAG